MFEPQRCLKEPIPPPAPTSASHHAAHKAIFGLGLFLSSLAVSTVATADSARFDLTGPKIEVRVTRGGVTLPIASVPNLQPGDRLWLHPDLPATQSIRYLMVVAFLRGTTNPPPDNWFIRVQAWDKKVREEGVEVIVPDEAQQAVLFLAPVTGGDFATLRSAVQGRPGIFVRAAQDLNLAGFEQARIEKYIASMRELPIAETTDPKALQEHSTLIAGTLALKPNADCMKISPDQQYTCLTQSGGQTLLDDGHGQSLVAALSNGPGSDFINQASYTQLAGAGVYSAYVGAVVDLVRIMGSLHTAQYQYIPAIAFPQQQSLNLRLNTPPSFHNPKSVIVIGLPSIQATEPPPLRPADPKLVACLAKPGVVLPVEGAPLVFSTSFAHDLVLHLNYPASAKPDPTRPQDIPLTADPYKGGLVLAPIPKRRALPLVKVSLPTLPPPSADKPAEQGTPATTQPSTLQLTGTIQGFWGFDTFTGPTMPLEDAPGNDWKIANTTPLIAGKDQQLTLSSTGTGCIQGITLDAVAGKTEKEIWKPSDQPNAVDVALKLSSLPDHDPGTLHLSVRQFGDPKPATVNLTSYAEPAKLNMLQFHAGDKSAVLNGSSLDEVRKVEFGGATFLPSSAAAYPDGKSELGLALSASATAPSLPAGDKLNAQVTLKDGRVLPLALVVDSPRPTVTLIGKAGVPSDEPKSSLQIKLTNPNDLRVTDALLFSLKSTQPFPRTGQIEVASPDGSLHATLNVANETLVLEDSQTLLAKLEPRKTLGASAFGPLRVRAVTPGGVTGDWLPLVTLVRLPTLTGMNCPIAPPAPPAAPVNPTPPPAATDPATPPVSQKDPPASVPLAPPAASCTLTGSNLYLIDSLAPDAAFTNPTRIPEGFVGNSLTVPAPSGALYYLRLRDDPAAANTITLPAGPL